MICGNDYPLEHVRRIAVVGAGKAAGYLALALEELLTPLANELQLEGFVNVPANCLVETKYVRLHAARPEHINEPTDAGVQGTREILKLVSSLRADDLCICLLTGGGSALLPAPARGVTLDDKLLVTRLLSSNGASIQQLNRVRIAMSAIKGGGLSRACASGHLVTLIVSDVIGDPLDLIASGPTVCQESSESAVDVLKQFAARSDLPDRLWRFFARSSSNPPPGPAATRVENLVLANNKSAVDAAARKASEMGMSVAILPPERSNETAEDVAARLIARLSTTSFSRPSCLVWGGEPVVRLAPDHFRGRGGRNQQLTLSVLCGWDNLPDDLRPRICILSGGTDGEDGPTDAAGAFVDQQIVQAARTAGLVAEDHLRRNDAYTFFDSVAGLHKTGPTHTNVCDLRIAVAL